MRLVIDIIMHPKQIEEIIENCDIRDFSKGVDDYFRNNIKLEELGFNFPKFIRESREDPFDLYPEPIDQWFRRL